MAEKKVAVVTGGSSGIGRATAQCLFEKGVKVYEFSRRDVPDGDIVHVSCDVTDEASVNRAVETVLEQEGKIDILINCAGFGIGGAVEFTDTEDAVRQLNVNFFGTVRCTKAVLTSMRKRGQGRIVNISSVAAPIPIPFQAFYSASKAANNSYTGALANEVRPYGVSVCAVMPGDIASGFTDARKKTAQGDSEYGGRIGRSLSKMEKDERGGMSPRVAGEYIAGIALKKKVKTYYAIGFSYKFFCVLIRLLPCRLSCWLLYKIYAE